MIILTEEQFRARKTSDTLCIMGCGYSINLISKSRWRDLDRFNSIGYNWYCKLRRSCTWYLIREQCASEKRLEEDMMLDNFLDEINSFRRTLIVKDNSYRKNNYLHVENLGRLNGEGAIFKEITGKCKVQDYLKGDIFKDGLRHGKFTNNDVWHFAVGMGYKRLIYVGVDLVDNRYFWLPHDGPKATLGLVRKEGRTHEFPHLNLTKTLSMAEHMKELGVEQYVENESSALSKIMPVWEG